MNGNPQFYGDTLPPAGMAGEKTLFEGILFENGCIIKCDIF
jgi:hypothetical protein